MPTTLVCVKCIMPVPDLRRFPPLIRLREGVKKDPIVANRSLNLNLNPQSTTKIVFFLRKRKKIQNVLKRKNMCFDEKICEIYSFGPVSRFRLFWIF